MASGNVKGGGVASDMASMMMGMNLANQMMKNIEQNQSTQGQPNNIATGKSAKPNFCPNCGEKTGQANFCPNCGHKLV